MGNLLTDDSQSALRKRAALGIAACVLSVFVLHYLVRPVIDWVYPKHFLSLAQYVEEHGAPVKSYAFIADYFGIPNDGNPLEYRAIGTRSITGRSKSIAVRHRPTGQIDMMIQDVLGNQSGYYYHANIYGKLLKGVFLETRPEEIPDGEARFATEVQFWRDYIDAQQEATAAP